MGPEQALNVDFAALAIADPAFEAIYRANDGRVDFQNPDHVQQLTKSILKQHFGLRLELPNDRLCPPVGFIDGKMVPVRYQYIRWLQDLVDTTSSTYHEGYDAERKVLGIDVGVGASCIYPLLGCASRPLWHFVGTEVDLASCKSSKQNVGLNDLDSRIDLRLVDPKGPILDPDLYGIGTAGFVMCNPPFFKDKEDMVSTHITKKRSPSAICTGADVEMITEGGDLGFVLRMLSDSTKLRDRVQWYSSMLGKLASAYALVDKLKDLGISNWAVTSLQAGSLTKRWAVAWSFGYLRPANDVARGDLSNREILPFPTESHISIGEQAESQAALKIREALRGLELTVRWKEDGQGGLVFAKGNVWSRSARRKRQRQAADAAVEDRTRAELSNHEDDSALNAALIVRLEVRPTETVIRWLKGNDSVLFESFCGMLKRMIEKS